MPRSPARTPPTTSRSSKATGVSGLTPATLVQIPAQKNTQTGKTQPAVAGAVGLLAQSS